MQRLIWSVLLAFLLAIALGPIVIPWLRKMKYGQTIYELGPESHKVKQGTPTMGGVIFTLPMLIVPLMFFDSAHWRFMAIVLTATGGFGLVGFVDDRIKVGRQRSLGLTPKQKLLPHIILSLALATWAYFSPTIGSKLYLPFTQVEFDIGWFFIPVLAFVMVATVNSSNLLDGLDGLNAGCSMLDFATLSLLLLAFSTRMTGELAGEFMNMVIFCGCAAGALLGYLRYNSHPASVIMGDVGSFAIGGALAGVCLVTRMSLVLPIIALGMLVSSLSDLIQFAYFRKTGGKRIFRMAPLHHHFELSGMPETRIVSMYMIVTAVMCLVTLLWIAG